MPTPSFLKKSVTLWTLTFLITAFSAVYQRMTGPTYPVTERVTLNGAEVSLRLERSHSTESDFTVAVPVADTAVTGSVFWKRFKTNDEWAEIPLLQTGAALQADLPRQPAAGKLEYRLALNDGERTQNVPAEGVIVVRFKGDVPAAILILHVMTIFGAMLLSTRAAFEALANAPTYRTYALLTVVFLFLGGLALGPVVQKYAFDAYWTGWPFGNDLTDNKTAVAFLAWLVAFFMLKRSAHPARWVIGAAVITLAVFMIPHSLLGSELDYSKVDAVQ